MTADEIRAHLAAAHAAWPGLVWEDASYAAWLSTAALAAPLASYDAAEVVLCWAAGRGDPEAHRILELHFISHVATALSRFRESAAFVEEVTQRVRVKLLVVRGTEFAPIAGYAFGGSLAGLVRIAAVREALSLRRGDKPVAPVEELEDVASDRDPELQLLKARYASEFELAFAAAVAELPSRDRQLLRLSLSVQASIDDIARIFQTHRATAARWLNSAREALAANTRRHLHVKLGLGESELTSLLRLVRTEATRMLATIPPGADE